MSIIPALRKLKQEDIQFLVLAKLPSEFKAYPGNSVKPHLKIKS